MSLLGIRVTIVAILVVSSIATVALAQEDKMLFHEAVGVVTPKHSCATLQSIPLKPLDTLVDVLEYVVYLDLYDGLVPMDISASTPETFKASVDIRLVVLSDTLTRVPLNADRFAIDVKGVVVNGQVAVFARSTNRLMITPPSVSIRKGDTLALHIDYEVTRSERVGLVVVNGADMLSALGSYPIAFTFSEPENARRWFPSNDTPYDKALFSARARVPADHRLVSNGELTRTVLDGDTAKIETWAAVEPMAPYLFVMNASKFTQIYQLYSRSDGTGVPIRNFHWDTDEAGYYNAPNAIRNIPAMFEAFEPRFGRYPFRSYGHCAVHPVQIGGMEHQTMSTVNRKWLDGTIEVGYAHELGHQWFGDAVTCATWGDIWLNEGGATFSEALWREFDEGPAGYRDQLMRRRERYMNQGQDSPPVWDIPIGNLFNEATTYAKSSWIFHMMRRMLGDEEFFSTLRLFFSTYKDKSIQTSQFESFWKQHVPNPAIDWDTFFNQWLVQRGHPEFRVMLSRSVTKPTELHVRVDQIQDHDGVPQVFHVPVDIDFIKDGVVLNRHALIMKTRTVEFTIDMAQDVTFEFDPEMKILHEFRSDPVGVANGRYDLQPYCDRCLAVSVIGSQPIVHGNDVLLGLEHVDASSRLTILDSRGEIVFTEPVAAEQNVLRINSARLSAGAYVAMLTSSKGTATVRFVIL